MASIKDSKQGLLRTVVAVILLTVVSCTKQFYVAKYDTHTTKVNSLNPADSSMWLMIQPYKDSLDVEMNVVVGISDVLLTKSQPESDLGNWMCDMMLSVAQSHYDGQIDFTLMNYGGIRIPSLPMGNITRGRLIELMPFENRMGVVKLKGTELRELFNHMAAKGGWPVSGARYAIHHSAAENVTIGGEPLLDDKEYTVATSDYLLQGGDNCTMLHSHPYVDLRITVRDALMEGLTNMNAGGKHIRTTKEGRVTLIK